MLPRPSGSYTPSWSVGPLPAAAGPSFGVVNFVLLPSGNSEAKSRSQAAPGTRKRERSTELLRVAGCALRKERRC